MANSMETLCKTIGIDRVLKKNLVIVIEEQHGTNANFLLHSVLWQALKTEQPVCFFLCQNTFMDYHNVCMRYGFNLLALKQEGQVGIVNLIECMACDILINMCKDTAKIIPNSASTKHADLAYKLFISIKDECEKAMKFNTSVLLIIEDLSHLLNLGLSVRDTMYFMRYIRSYLSLTHSQLCVLVHTCQENAQYSDPDMLLKMLHVMAYLSLTTEPLKSGFSFNASGKMIVHWRHDVIRSRNNWMEKATYLYKLLEWQVKVFPPGAASILS